MIVEEFLLKLFANCLLLFSCKIKKLVYTYTNKSKSTPRGLIVEAI